MPKKKPKVQAAYNEPVTESAKAIRDAVSLLLTCSTEADLMFSAARHAWATDQNDLFWRAIERLSWLVYQASWRVQRQIDPATFMTQVANVVVLASYPDADVQAKLRQAMPKITPMSLIRMRPDDAMSVSGQGDKQITEGFGKASDAEVKRARKDLATSKAIQEGRPAPSDRGRRREPHYASETDFREWISPYIRSVRKREGAATKEKVAAAVTIEPTHLGRRCQELTGLDWPGFVATVPDELGQ